MRYIEVRLKKMAMMWNKAYVIEMNMGMVYLPIKTRLRCVYRGKPRGGEGISAFLYCCNMTGIRLEMQKFFYFMFFVIFKLLLFSIM